MTVVDTSVVVAAFACRTLPHVNTRDAAQADETLDVLKGDQVPPRNKFTQTRAKYVRHLDA